MSFERDDALTKAEAAVRGIEGVADVRAVEDSLVIYVPDGSAALPRIVLVLNDAGVPTRQVTLAQPTLDDVFLRATGRHMTSEGGDVQVVTGGRR